MSKAVDARLCTSIFPEIIELRFRNESDADAENKNFVKAMGRFKLYDAAGNELALRVLESTLWEGMQKLTLAQVTNNLETALGGALTQARINLTGA